MSDLDLELSEMTLLKFKDFVPEQVSKASIWTGRGEYRSLASSLREANSWLVNQSGVDLINIETVVLPSIHSDKEEGTEDPELLTQTGGMPQAWHQFIRVWYMEQK
ncbi:MAG: hypothetical protein AAF399_13375 [Bacteroidota bacterium]